MPQMTSRKPTACVCIELGEPEIGTRCGRERQAGEGTCTALPFTSEPMEAAVAMVLGTMAVLVSQMCTEDMGIFSSRLATWEKNKYFRVWSSLLGRCESFF